MISSPGLGSGLDVNSIVSQLVAIEQEPLIRIVQQQADFQFQISAYGTLRSALSTFESSLAAVNSLSDFKVLTAKSSDEDVLTASAGSSASKGTFDLTVNRIAENHRLAMNNVFADADTTLIGADGDSLTITQGSDDFEIEFGGKTLNEVRDLINDASANTGVTASILNDDLGVRLLLSADDTGSENFISLSYSGADPFSFIDLNADRDGDLSFTAADLDAEITVDNMFTATRSSNTIKDVVQGVTINLVGSGTSTLSVAEDDGAVQDSVQTFVDAYNTALTTIRDLRAGALKDDANSLYAIENQIREVLNTSLQSNGTYSSVYELGISSTFILGVESQDNGKLNLDTAELLDALGEDRDSLANLFTDADNGIIPGLESLLGSFVDFQGLIDGKTDSLGRRISSLESSAETLSQRLESYEERLLAQFTTLDTTIAQLQTTSNFLTQQLAVFQTPSR